MTSSSSRSNRSTKVPPNVVFINSHPKYGRVAVTETNKRWTERKKIPRSGHSPRSGDMFNQSVHTHKHTQKRSVQSARDTLLNTRPDLYGAPHQPTITTATSMIILCIHARTHTDNTSPHCPQQHHTATATASQKDIDDIRSSKSTRQNGCVRVCVSFCI